MRSRAMRFSPSRATWYKIARIAVFYVLLIGAWWAVAAAEVWSPFLFPAPDGVYRALVLNVENGQIPAAIVASLQRMAIG